MIVSIPDENGRHSYVNPDLVVRIELHDGRLDFENEMMSKLWFVDGSYGFSSEPPWSVADVLNAGPT